MKKLFCLLSLIVMMACNKNSPAPTTNPSPSTNQNNSNNNLTAQEQSLLGLWLLDSVVRYDNNIRQSVSVSSNTTSCRMQFYDTDYINNSTGFYNVDDGHIWCNLKKYSWKAPNAGYFELSTSTFPIIQLTSTKFVFSEAGGSSEWRYYLHK
jgi:hypothetical protein